MQNRYRGLVTALLCVAFLILSGCGKEEPLYTAGLVAQKEEDTAEENADGADAGDSSSEAESAYGSNDDKANGADRADDLNGALTNSDSTDNSISDTGDISETLAGLSATEGAEAFGQPETLSAIGYVYVCGAVREPGVYPIYVDTRVCDAIDLAGGFSAEADEEWLNQAAAVADGQKLYVYTLEETSLMKEAGMTPEGLSQDPENGVSSNGSGTVTADSGVGMTDASETKVNLNTATREELMTLPGIGESKADAILSYRSENGAFASIEEIQNISGIKSGVYSKIKELITV